MTPIKSLFLCGVATLHYNLTLTLIQYIKQNKRYRDSWHNLPINRLANPSQTVRDRLWKKKNLSAFLLFKNGNIKMRFWYRMNLYLPGR